MQVHSRSIYDEFLHICKYSAREHNVRARVHSRNIYDDYLHVSNKVRGSTMFVQVHSRNIYDLCVCN